MGLEDYEPVLYQVTKNPRAGSVKESFSEIQDGFLERSERLLKIFHERSHIHDGLKNLSENEIILKVRESPNKLKKFAITFLKKLRKLNVTL